MGRIKEHLGVDFEVDPRPLTPKEQLAISEFIKEDKAKRALLEKRPTKTKMGSQQSIKKWSEYIK